MIRDISEMLPPRARRPIQACVGLFAFAWCVWFGHARWTAAPPATPTTSPAPAAIHAKVGPLRDALIAISPPDPQVTGRGVAMCYLGLANPMPPAPVKTPDDAALDRVCAALESIDPPDADDAYLWLDARAPVSPGKLADAQVIYCRRSLESRAERRIAARDPHGAWRDLCASLMLTERIAHAHLANRAAWATTGRAPGLLAQLAETRTLTAEQCRHAIKLLRGRDDLSVARRYRAILQAPDDIEAVLDRFYTRDADNDGWLVLSHWRGNHWLEPASASAPRSPAWNLLSLGLSGRDAARAALADFFHAVDQADALPAADTTARLWSAGRRINGPFSSHHPWIDPMSGLAEFTDGRRRAVIALSLALFHLEHGEYPYELANLTPAYLPDVPIEPISATPYRYNRASADEYRLWAPWRDE